MGRKYEKELRQLKVLLADHETQQLLEKSLSELTIKDLEVVMVDFGGLMDPIGQLQSWLASQLSSLAQWIVNSLNTIISPVYDALQSVLQFMSSLQSTLSELITGFGDVLNTVNQLITMFHELVITPVTEFIEQLQVGISSIIESISQLAQEIVATLSQIPDIIEDIIEQIVTTLSASVQELSQVIQESLIRPLIEASRTIVDAISQIPSIIQTALNALYENVQRAIEPISSAIQTIVDAVSQIPSTIASALDTIRTGLLDMLTQAAAIIQENLIDPIKGFIDSIIETLTQIPDIIDEINNKLGTLFEDISTLVQEKVISPLLDFIDNVPAYAEEVIEDAQKWVWEHMPDFVRQFMEEAPKALSQVGTAVMGFVNAILKFPEWFPNWFDEYIKKPIDSIGEAIGKIAALFESIQEILQQPGQFVKTYIIEPITDAFTAIWETAPDWLTSIGVIGATLQTFIENPLEFAKERIVEPMLSGINWLIEPITETIKNMWGITTGLIKWSLEQLKKFVQSLPQMFSDFLKFLIEAGGKIAKPIVDTITVVPKSFLEGFSGAIQEFLGKAFKDAAEGKQGEVDIVVGAFLAGLPFFMLGMFIPDLFKYVAHVIKTLRLRVEGSLEPLGLGGKLIGEIFTDLARIFYIVGQRMESVPTHFMQAFAISFQLMGFEPLRYPFRFVWKQYFSRIGLGDLPFEIPPIEMTRDIARRYGLGTNINYLKRILTYRGMPDWFIERMTKLAPTPSSPQAYRQLVLKTLKELYKELEQGYATVKDRFGRTRIVPASLVYTQPSMSDIIRFMIRDMFTPPGGTAQDALPNFIKWSHMLGLHPDTAIMYYYLHFRYPAPRTLWKFVMRGISGLLWFSPTQADINEAKSEAETIGAYQPLPPVQLNFDAEGLLSALGDYMKWHDYAKYAWTPNFTSDNWLVMDTLAKIPDKIDQRWMVKWGLYEKMRESNVKFTDAIHDITQKLIAPKAASQIEMDLEVFCRTLQATELHPDWVPIVAVAEAMNMLSEERTLLRTGFINIYKEGFFTYKDLEKLLSGFFVAAFKVRWFDISKLQWKTGYINLPIMFLPPERKLLQLRAAFDRAIDILRDMLKTLVNAVRDYIYSPEDAQKMLSDYVDAMNEVWFVKEISEITGISEQQVVKLTVDSSWIKLFTKYGETLRDVYAYIRLRYYARYILWRLLYRVQAGYITLKEAEKWFSNIVDKIRESPLLKDFLLEASDMLIDGFVRQTKANAILAKLSRRQITYKQAIKELTKLGLTKEVAEALVEWKARPYRPTIITYATMLEIVPEAIELKDKMLQLFAFPEDEKQYWELYLERKPVADELQLLRTRIYRALASGVTMEDIVSLLKEGIKPKNATLIYERHKDVLENYGIILREWQLYWLIAEFESMIHNAREYIPTPAMMATIIEYVPAARKFAEQVFKARRVPKEWQTIWLTYYNARVMYNDVQRIVSRYLMLVERFPVPKEVDNFIEKLLKQVGYEKAELELFNIDKKLRIAYRTFMNSIPTIRQFVTDAYYLPDVEKLFDQLTQIRRVTKEAKDYYKTLIKNRKAWRWLDDYIRELVYAYSHGAITEQKLKDELGKLAKFGLDPIEKEIIINWAKLRKIRLEAS